MIAINKITAFKFAELHEYKQFIYSFHIKDLPTSLQSSIHF